MMRPFDPLDSTVVNGPAAGDDLDPSHEAAVDVDDEPRPPTPEEAAALAAALEAEGEPDFANALADVRDTPESEHAEAVVAPIPKHAQGEMPREKIALAPGLQASSPATAALPPPPGHSAEAARLPSAGPADPTALSLRAVSDDDSDPISATRRRRVGGWVWIAALAIGAGLAALAVAVMERPSGAADAPSEPAREPAPSADEPVVTTAEPAPAPPSEPASTDTAAPEPPPRPSAAPVPFVRPKSPPPPAQPPSAQPTSGPLVDKPPAPKPGGLF
jgi:hypothetical protein